MATEVDFSSIFDTALPNVYIKKISVSHSSIADSGAASHFDEQQRYFFEENEYGKKFFSKRQRDNFEQIAAGKFLVVNAKLVIKDQIKRNKKTRWFEDEQLLNILKLRVLLSQKSQVTNDLRRRGLTRKNIDNYKDSGLLNERILSLRKSGDSRLESYKKERVGGRTIYSVTYDVSFKIYNPNPEHLAIFACTVADINEYSRQKKVATKSHRKDIFGNFVGQLILDGGQTPSTSNIFISPAGKVWAGAVHSHKKRCFMAGPFHTNQPHPPLKNIKIPTL